VIDVFGQLSSETLSSTLVVDTLTIAELRAEAIYSDSASTAAATLKAALADDNRSSGGISYTSNAGWARWVRFERPLLERYRTLTISMTPASGTSSWYVRTSQDGATWSYFAGPVTSSRILTAVADAAAAQAAAVSAATLGGSSANRVDLPSITEARYVELWLRNTAASTRVDEFYPRRLVQSDDIEAESIKAINIAAGTITGDRILATALDAFTITGATIRTASSGARVELSAAANGGLIGYASGDTYNPATGSGTYQVLWRKTDGALVAGAGAVKIDSSGIDLESITSNAAGVITFNRIITGTPTPAGGVYLSDVGGSNGGLLTLSGFNGDGAGVRMLAQNGSGASYFNLTRSSTYAIAFLDNGRLAINGAGTPTLALEVTGGASVSAGLNVGSASGASSGQVRASYGYGSPQADGTQRIQFDGTVGGSSISIANNATITPFGASFNFSGLILVSDTLVDGATALFISNASTITEVSDPANLFTTTAGTASSYNVYFSGSTITIENKRGATRALNVVAIRCR